MTALTDEQRKALLAGEIGRSAAFLKAMEYPLPPLRFRGWDMAKPGSDRTAIFVWRVKPWHRRLWERVQAWWRHRVRGEPIEVTVKYEQRWEITDLRIERPKT